MDISIRQCLFESDGEMSQLIELQNIVYKQRGLLFTKELFKFWYLDNPNGRVISFCAFDGDKMVSHQAFIPMKMKVGEIVYPCVRSMAVVTHPDYQGKGLFSKLTNLAVDYARNNGYAFAFAVTNEKSFGAFVKYAGFQHISNLDVRIIYGSQVVPKDNIVYSNFWDAESIKWRLSYKKYSIIGDCILGKYMDLVDTYMGTISVESIESLNNLTRKNIMPVSLYVGIGAILPKINFGIPKFVKHSPFNLIYKDLSEGKIPAMAADNIFYQLIDFDVV